MGLAGFGVSGELVVGGVPVGRGYIDDPVRTSTSFFPDPFSATPGARLYRTGDVARVKRDGTIDFVGRRDHQIKLRGHRIELGEIDAALRSLPLVREAATILAAGPWPMLVSFVV